MPIKSRIRTIPNYPVEGVMFRDVTTLMLDPVGFRKTIDELVHRSGIAGIDEPGVPAGVQFHVIFVGAGSTSDPTVGRGLQDTTDEGPVLDDPHGFIAELQHVSLLCVVFELYEPRICIEGFGQEDRAAAEDRGP